MRVLVACESSGEVSSAFRARGHDAWSCDLLEADGDSRYHIQGDCFEALSSASWDLLIAHPPCTYLAISAAWAFKDGPYHQKVKPGTLVGADRRAAREDAIRFVEALWDAPVPRVAIENPVGAISSMSKLGKATQYIHPFEFGDNASKRTGLWLRGLMPLQPTKFIEPRMVCGCKHTFDFALGQYGCPNCEGEQGPAKQRWDNQTDSGQNKLGPSDDRWKVRSKTYAGIAEAMASQWG